MKMSELELSWPTWRDLTELSGKCELQKWAFSKPVPVLDGGNWDLCPGSSSLGVPAPGGTAPSPLFRSWTQLSGQGIVSLVGDVPSHPNL